MHIPSRLFLWFLPLISLNAFCALPPPPGTEPTPPPDIDLVPPNAIYVDRARILNPQTQQESKKLLAGQTYLLRIKTEGLSHLRNWNVLYYGRFNAEQNITRLVEFKLDPAQDKSAMVEVGPAPYLEWSFTLPDAGYHYDRGSLRLAVIYKKQNFNNLFRFTNYYFIEDKTPESALAINNGPPLITLYPSISHTGTARTDVEIQNMLAEMQQHFHFAGKGYVGMNYDYDGRGVFPADNQVFEGVLHDYVNWWNSVPHNLSGTDLLPLNPNDPQDLEMIKQAWYTEVNKPQYRKDVEASVPGSQNIMLAEGPGWFSVAPGSQAFIALYNSMPFMQNGQYGQHEKFDWRQPDHIQKTILHEYGHTLGLPHPTSVYLPDQANWTVMVNPLDRYDNLMHQGDLNDYPTNRFYTDDDIDHMVTLFGGNVIDAPSIDIPDVTPIGDPVIGSQWTLHGLKEALAGITINGQEVIPPGDTSVSWSAPVDLSAGVNRFDVAQRKLINGELRDSHPNIVYTTRLPRTLLPLSPEIQFTDLPDLQVNPGQSFSFKLSAKALAGLDSIKWWVERKTGYQQGYVPILNMFNWRNLYGSATASHQYDVAFEVPALYRIRAEARDRNNQASTVAEIILQVGNPRLRQLYNPAGN